MELTGGMATPMALKSYTDAWTKLDLRGCMKPYPKKARIHSQG